MGIRQVDLHRVFTSSRFTPTDFLSTPEATQHFTGLHPRKSLLLAERFEWLGLILEGIERKTGGIVQVLQGYSPTCYIPNETPIVPFLKVGAGARFVLAYPENKLEEVFAPTYRGGLGSKGSIYEIDIRHLVRGHADTAGLPVRAARWFEGEGNGSHEI